jgi:hypothetical protein
VATPTPNPATRKVHEVALLFPEMAADEFATAGAETIQQASPKPKLPR